MNRSMGSPADSLFVDTDGWVEPLLRSSPHYPLMVAYSQQTQTTQRPLVTTNYVINEVVALLNARPNGPSRHELLQFVNGILALPQLTLVHIDVDLARAAWRLLEQRPDKAWSLVDAASFVVMRQQSIAEAFTGDHHFLQAGFIRVPHRPSA